MAYQDRRSFVLYQLYGQIMVLTLAALNTYYPQYLSYTFLAFIAISFLISFPKLKSQLKGPALEQLKEIKGSRKIYEEEDSKVLRLISSDAQLAQEMKPLTRSLILSFLAIFFSLAWYYLYFNFAGSLTSDVSIAGPSKFIVFLIGYETPYALMVVVSISQTRAAKSFMQIPRSYILFESGLVGQGTFIKFPADNYEVELDLRRKFVELISKDEKKPMRVRLYSSKPDELFNLIKKYGFSNP